MQLKSSQVCVATFLPEITYALTRRNMFHHVSVFTPQVQYNSWQLPEQATSHLKAKILKETIKTLKYDEVSRSEKGRDG